MKQPPISSSPIDRQLLTLSCTSYPLASTYANDTSVPSHVTQQQPTFSSFSIQQHQVFCKNRQPQHAPAIRHASQVSQQCIQEQAHQHHQPCSTTTTFQKATLPTCSIPQYASRAYSNASPAQKTICPQRSASSASRSSAFSPLSVTPTRQQQLKTHQSAYNYQQQFLLQQRQQQPHNQMYGEQQHQVNASQDHRMYNNWR